MPALEPMISSLANLQQQQQAWAPIWSSSFLLVCWMPSCLYEFLFIVFLLVDTALLICMENSFWGRDITEDGSLGFVELFKESFTLYVESGKSETVEIDIDTLRNEDGEFLVTKDFEAKFYGFIVDHYLRKFCYFHLH